MIVESLSLMVLGMGIVFTFLIILLFSVIIMGKVIQKYFPEPVVSNPVKPASSSAPSDQGAVVAAISTAIAMHRRRTL